MQSCFLIYYHLLIIIFLKLKNQLFKPTRNLGGSGPRGTCLKEKNYQEKAKIHQIFIRITENYAIGMPIVIYFYQNVQKCFVQKCFPSVLACQKVSYNCISSRCINFNPRKSINQQVQEIIGLIIKDRQTSNHNRILIGLIIE